MQRLPCGSLCLGLMPVTGKTAEEVCLPVGLNKWTQTFEHKHRTFQTVVLRARSVGQTGRWKAHIECFFVNRTLIPCTSVCCLCFYLWITFLLFDIHSSSFLECHRKLEEASGLAPFANMKWPSQGGPARDIGLGMRQGLDQVTSERDYLSRGPHPYLPASVFPSTPFRPGSVHGWQ